MLDMDAWQESRPMSARRVARMAARSATLMWGEEMPEPISGAGIHRLLVDLIVLSGQQVETHPVLELWIGDILTRTSVAHQGREAFLSVTAILPGCRPHKLSDTLLASAVLPQSAMEETELLWDADHGRYVVVCKFRQARLCDERGVMDAILDTADAAQQCLQGIAAT